MCSVVIRLKKVRTSFTVGVVELKGGIRNRSWWTAGLSRGKPGVDVRGDGQDNIRKEERIRDETDRENTCYDLIDFWIMELWK